MHRNPSPDRPLGGGATRVAPAAFALVAIIAIIAILAASLPAAGQTSRRGLGRLKRGDPAPAFALRDTDGAAVTSAGLRGTILILLFCESDQERSMEAIGQVDVARREPELRGVAVEWIVLMTKGSDPARLPRLRTDDLRPPIVVHDTGRDAFGAYGVTVVPSTVIVDAAGRIVHALAGLPPSAADVIPDALLLAAGRIDARRFEETLHPTLPAPVDPDVRRADRLTRLARRMSEHGMIDEALAGYEEAARIDPTAVAAHLGVGLLLLQREELERAASRFRTVLTLAPASIDAALGLATVHLRRESGDVAAAESRVRDVLERDPASARGHYLMGLVHDRRQKPEAAAASFRRAAELLLEQAPWTSRPAPADQRSSRRPSRDDHLRGRGHSERSGSS